MKLPEELEKLGVGKQTFWLKYTDVDLEYIVRDCANMCRVEADALKPYTRGWHILRNREKAILTRYHLEPTK